MTNFDPRKHPRGGDPAHPGRWSAKTQSESDLELAAEPHFPAANDVVRGLRESVERAKTARAEHDAEATRLLSQNADTASEDDSAAAKAIIREDGRWAPQMRRHYPIEADEVDAEHDTTRHHDTGDRPSR